MRRRQATFAQQCHHKVMQLQVPVWKVVAGCNHPYTLCDLESCVVGRLLLEGSEHALESKLLLLCSPSLSQRLMAPQPIKGRCSVAKVSPCQAGHEQVFRLDELWALRL